VSRTPRIWLDETKRQPDGRVDPYASYPAIAGPRTEDVAMRYRPGIVDPLVRELVRLKNAVHTQCEI
jgi:hypothetical protein